MKNRIFAQKFEFFWHQKADDPGQIDSSEVDIRVRHVKKPVHAKFQVNRV